MHLFEPKEKYELNDLIFENLSSEHKTIIQSFGSYQKELVDFLKQDALKSQQYHISNTYLLFDKQDKDRTALLGYITILNDSIRLDGDLKSYFRMKGIQYKSLPALKIGRLCVDDKYSRRRLGECLLLFSIKIAKSSNQSSACRFITLDAKRYSEPEKDSFHFYKRYGFKILKMHQKEELEIIKQRSGTTPMYLDLYFMINE
jgi:predicted GNAT family N-acyltransferase